jgi:4-amino-4-deoxy-L-arabinose transferase-like glycosyltransferase
MYGEMSANPGRAQPAGTPADGAAPWLRWLVRVVLALALANALYSAWREGWTYDEPFHLEWTERLLKEHDARRESPHYNAKTPVVLPNVLANLAARQVTSSEALTRLASRLPSVALLAALLATTFLVGRALFGPTAAWLAALAAGLDPNLAAHGSVVTVDVAYALGTLLTVAAATAFGARPSPARAIALGLAVGFALTAKFSAILLLPTLLLLPLLVRPPRREWPRWLLGALLVAAVAAATVCAAYLFLDVAQPLGSRHWLSRPMKHFASALPWLRLPLPTAFLTGYDVSLAAERGDWNVVILSRWYPHGVWFYFAVLWLIKTPLLLLLAEVCGLVAALRSRRLRHALGARLLLATLLVHLGYFSLIFRTQVGYRFVLMCIPIACLLAAAGLAPAVAAGLAAAGAASPGGLERRRRTALAILAVTLVAVAENATYAGNPLSFSNAAVWPKKQVFRLMADSNLDWGQHDEEMEAWRRRPGFFTHFNPLHFLPGHNTFSVNEVAGVSDFERHRFLREHADPVGQIGHTHVWFEVDEALFDRFMDAERRFPTTPLDAAACPASPGYEPLSQDSPAHVFLEGSAGATPTWLVCVRTTDGADLGLRSQRGRLVLGRYRGDQGCEGETVEEGQESWHRLPPGPHALCAAELANRDPTQPHPFEGTWLARHGSASLARAVLASTTFARAVDAATPAR